MGEPAVAPQQSGVNPNIAVGDEGRTESRANDSLSFDDIDALTPEKGQKKKESAKAPEKQADETGGVRGNRKEEPPKIDGDEEDEPKPKKDKGEKSEKDEKAPADGKAPKAKNLRYKVGDSEVEIPEDAEFTQTVDGKKETVKLRDLLNTRAGEETVQRRLSKLDVDKKAFERKQADANALIQNLYERSKTDPEAAVDFLCEATKTDPVKYKEAQLRDTIKKLEPIMQMGEDDREKAIQDMVRSWRDRQHEQREKFTKDQAEKTKESEEKSNFQKEFGIDDEEYEAATGVVKRYFEKNPPKDWDGKITAGQVIHAARHMMAMHTISQVVPHLANRKDFDSIVSDIVSDLLKHPSITREKLANQLTEVFGTEDDKKNLKKLARKVNKNTEADDLRPRNPSTDALSFDDL